MSLRSAMRGDRSAWSKIYDLPNGLTAYGLRDNDKAYTAYRHGCNLAIYDGAEQIFSAVVA